MAATLVATTVLLSATAVAATVVLLSVTAAAATVLLLLLLLSLQLNPSRTRVLITPNVLRLLTRMLSSFAVPTTRTTTKLSFA